MKLFKFILFMESRKVGFGLWIFLTSTYFLTQSLITADNWLLCVFLSTSLLGGGTIADKYLEVQKHKNGGK